MNKTPKSIIEILEKISELKKLDSGLSVFGADSHKYEFNKSISEIELSKFEKKHQITLPSEFRNFLLHFGNGGCGPNYGLFNLEIGVFDIPQNKQNSKIINLSNDFRFDTFWNLEELLEKDYDLWEDEYDEVKWIDGLLRISHLGCGNFANIVISGKERGNIWYDDRCSEGGIYPANYYNKQLKTDFISWYLRWLDSSKKSLIK